MTEHETFILFYDKYHKKFRLENHRGFELVDNVILHNVTFFIAPQTQDIINKERKSKMSHFEAKFPHAFAIATLKDSDMSFAEKNSLYWRDFNYDVFNHDFFFLEDTKESLKGLLIKHLMIKTSEDGEINRMVIL